jgi:hypothetical protein
MNERVTNHLSKILVITRKITAATSSLLLKFKISDVEYLKISSKIFLLTLVISKNIEKTTLQGGDSDSAFVNRL